MSGFFRREEPPSLAEARALPLRYPDVKDTRAMNRRAAWLIILGVLIPGSAQALAGNRILGRIGLGATLLGWLIVLINVIFLIASPSGYATFATNSVVLVIFQTLIVLYVVLWILLILDAVRLTRLVSLSHGVKAAVAGSMAVLIVFLGAGGAFAFSTLGTTRSTLDAVLSDSSEIEPPADGYYNFLLLGADSGPDRDGLRPDSISVASVNAETGKITFFGLPRDLSYVPFPADSPMHALYPDGYGASGCDVDPCQLNSIYTEVELFHPELYPDAAARGSSPGIEAMRDAAEGALDLTIQYFVLIDMQGFIDLIDALGGVTINVRERLPVQGVPDEETGEMILVEYWIEPGIQVMDGYTAVWYARSRYTTSDYDRMERQREVQEALLRQFEPLTILSKLDEFAEAGIKMVTTDIPQGMFGTFVELALKARDEPMTSVEMTPPNVDPEYPDYGYIAHLVREQLVPPTPDPTGDPDAESE